MAEPDATIDTAAFIASLMAFQKKTKLQFGKLLRKVALMILRETVKNQHDRRAVDTGLSIGNWQCTVGRDNEDIMPIGTQPESAAVQQLYYLKNEGIGEVIFIFNNVRYTIYLEFGTDKMAPRAMLRDAISSVTQQLG